MPKFKAPKLTEKEIHEKESMVHGGQEKTKHYANVLPPHELILLNYHHLKNQEEIFNLIDNHTKKEEMGKPKTAGQSMIFYFNNGKKAVSLGRQLARAFKKSQAAIKWSKVNNEVKVYVDFSNVL